MSALEATAERSLLEARDLRKVFDSGRAFSIGHRPSVTAVDGVSFYVGNEEALGLVGESGSGKSTTARLLLGLDEPTGGAILFRGQDIASLHGRAWSEYRMAIQSVFQDPWSSLNPRRSIGASIGEPLKVMTDLSRKDREARIAELLKLVGLPVSLTTHYPHELSGGMRQRVSIARSIAPWPKCVVLDEPVSSLDVSIKAQVMNLLKELQEKLSVSYLLIAHDLATVRFLANRTAVMYRGRIVELADTETLFRNPMHPYTRELFAASSGLITETEDIATTASGRSWSRPDLPTIPEAGCAYRMRGNERMDHCDGMVPTLEEIEPGHYVACYLCDDTQAR